MHMLYRYYTLECDACKAPMGKSSDPAHPSRGITICNDCWATPTELPRHLKATIALDQVAYRASRQITHR